MEGFRELDMEQYSGPGCCLSEVIVKHGASMDVEVIGVG